MTDYGVNLATSYDTGPPVYNSNSRTLTIPSPFVYENLFAYDDANISRGAEYAVICSVYVDPEEGPSHNEQNIYGLVGVGGGRVQTILGKQRVLVKKGRTATFAMTVSEASRIQLKLEKLTQRLKLKQSRRPQ